MNLVQRVAGAVIGVLLIVVGLVFASVVLAVSAAVALLVWAWLWWRTRDLRRAAQRADGTVIEGEFRVEREVQRLDDDAR